jgi:endonuclease YncB( thermonuclease family)
MGRITEWDAQVTKIVDGDTFHCDVEIVIFGKKEIYKDVIIRMKGIDTPERDRPGYQDAKDYTKKRLLNNFIVIRCDMEEQDNWQRQVAIPMIQGRDFTQELIEQKLCRVWYPGIKKGEGFPEGIG